MEAGVIVGFNHEPLFWHLPPGRTAGSLPDSRQLWDVLWENRARVYGFAHSHPGSGAPAPSWEDITTFAGVEAALGRRLVWWITSSTHLAYILWCGPDKYNYEVVGVDAYDGTSDPPWLDELRQHSNYERK